MIKLSTLPCAGCHSPVAHVEDIDTGEPIVVDADQVDDGHIAIYSLKGHAFARRHGRPARIQPAWQEHDCPTPTLATPVAKPTVDPYEDKPAADQQHGGWRA